MNNIDIISDNKIYYIQVDNPNIDSIDINSSSANDINIDVIDNGLTIISGGSGSVNEVNNLSDTVTWTTVPDAYITQSSVTQHESAITITEGQISDFGSYLTNISSLSINELFDVDTSSIAAVQGDVLSWNSTDSEWQPLAISTVDAAEHVQLSVKNVSGGPLLKGTPVYINGTVGATDILEVSVSDNSIASTMPATGLLKQDLENNEQGYIVVAGFLQHITTDSSNINTGGLGDPNEGDTIYVDSGGGLTTIKPVGVGSLIQNVGKVGKVSGGAAGSMIVSCIMRSNDVPNLSPGKIWVGDSNTVESSVVHLDEANVRLGVGTDVPGVTLDVNGDFNASSIIVNNSFTFPTADGSINQVLQTDGSGSVSWATISSGSSDIISEGDTSVEVADTGSDGHIDFTTEGTDRWEITSSGHLLPSTNADYDIGSATRKVRDLYVDSASLHIGSIDLSESNGKLVLPACELSGHLIPDTNASYDLGSAEYKIRHLFLSQNSIYIGGLPGENGNKISVSNDELVFTNVDETSSKACLIPNVVPTTDTASGKKGQIAVDSNYFYVCISDNTWRRLSLGFFEDF